MLNLIEQIKTECLFAFCHARINGAIGKWEKSKRKEDKELVYSGNYGKCRT